MTTANEVVNQTVHNQRPNQPFVTLYAQAIAAIAR